MRLLLVMFSLYHECDLYIKYVFPLLRRMLLAIQWSRLWGGMFLKKNVHLRMAMNQVGFPWWKRPGIFLPWRTHLRKTCWPHLLLDNKRFPVLRISFSVFRFFLWVSLHSKLFLLDLDPTTLTHFLPLPATLSRIRLVGWELRRLRE